MSKSKDLEKLAADFVEWYNLFGNWEKNQGRIKESECFQWIVYGFIQNMDCPDNKRTMKFDEDMKLAEEIIVEMNGKRIRADDQIEY